MYATTTDSNDTFDREHFILKKTAPVSITLSNTSIDPAINMYLTNYSSSVNSFANYTSRPNITAFVHTARQIASGEYSRSPSPFSRNYPIEGEVKDRWEFNPNQTQNTPMASTAYKLNRPSLTSMEPKKVELKTVQKKPTGKLKLPNMAN